MSGSPDTSWRGVAITQANMIEIARRLTTQHECRTCGRSPCSTPGFCRPACITRALLSVERLPRRIWEPAAGRGAIVKVLRDAGRAVVATDLVDYGEPDQLARRDLLLERQAPHGCKAIVTNPPFKLAGEFAAHALDLEAR